MNVGGCVELGNRKDETAQGDYARFFNSFWFGALKACCSKVEGEKKSKGGVAMLIKSTCDGM